MTSGFPVIAVALLVAVGCEGANPTPSAAQTSGTVAGAVQQTAPLPPPPARSIDESRRTAITNAVDRVAPAVVTVQTETVERGIPVDFYEYFSGRGSGQRKSAGIGSGFIIRSDGVVVTNAHVIGGATSVSVAMRDGTTYTARTVGVDETNDIAVLRIDAKDLPVAPMGTSSDLLVGEWAIAIGNPFGFVLGNTEPSVSVGVISGTGRNIAGRPDDGGAFVDMIQTDAAINPGNSGGPLVNALGEVIGVNSSIYSPTGGNVGLGFAIPIDRTRRIADDLLEHGAVRQAWVGLRLETPDASSIRDAAKAGAVVSRVVSGSPADKVGIHEGDQIIRAAGRPVRNAFDWEARLRDVRVGQTMMLVLKRGNRNIELSVEASVAPEFTQPRVTVLQQIQLVSLTSAIRQERGVSSAAGALVVQTSDQITDRIGLQSGDVIVQVNNERVNSAEAASRAIDAASARGSVVLIFERSRQLLQTRFYLR